MGRNRAARSAASSISMVLATMSLPIASTAVSYITRVRHIALKFDGELLRLYVISAHASVPRCIIRSTHLLRMKPMLSPPGVGSDFRTHQGRPNGRVRRWASSGYWRWPSPAKAISPGGITFRASALSANPTRCEFPCASLMAPPGMILSCRALSSLRKSRTGSSGKCRDNECSQRRRETVAPSCLGH